jgi:hypothetical protein
MQIGTLSLPALQILLADAASRDMVTARRKAIFELLLHERYLTRENIITRIEGQLGKNCFGAASWKDAFYRDIRIVKDAFKAAGHSLGYTRSPQCPGYILNGEPSISDELKAMISHSTGDMDLAQIKIFRSLTPQERCHLGSSITDAAIRSVAHRVKQRYPAISLQQASYFALQGKFPG